jgi:hypothetical protein
MANDECAERAAQSQQNEPVLVLGMIGIVDQYGTLIEENRMRFIERHAVLPAVRRVLPVVPFEPEVSHITV